MPLGFGFGPERRIRRRADFVRMRTVGQRTTTPHFVLLVGPQPEDVPKDAPSRLGLVVTKKVGNAVERNRIKRVCRECFRMWPDFVPNGFDLVVIAKVHAQTLGLNDVRTEWSRAHPAILRRCRPKPQNEGR